MRCSSPPRNPTRAPKKRRDLAHSATYTWLWDHADVVEDAIVRKDTVWAALAETMALDGVLTSRGKPPGRDYVRHSWSRVSVDLAADREARKLAAERAGHRSRRTKGWVPPSSPPAQPVPSHITSRRDTTIAPHLRAAAPPAPTPISPPPRTNATPAPTALSSHLLGEITPEEAEALAPYDGMPEQARAAMLRTIRTMAHMDRFNKPFRK
jgi:hypothetical protein